MKFKIIKNSNFKILTIANELSILVNKQKELNPIASSYSFASLQQKEVVIFCNNNNNEYLLFIEEETKEAYIEFCKLLNNINIEDSFHLLLIAEKLNFNEEDFFNLFPVLKWQYHKKGIYYFNLIKEFSPFLKMLLFETKLSIKDASYFYQRFKSENYDSLLELIPENLTFSERNELIRNTTDYAKKENKNIYEINNILKNSEDLLKKSFELKYPFYSKYISIFENFLEKLKIKKHCKIKFDQTFEKEEYSMEIKFKSMDELHKKLISIIQSIDEYKKGGEDFFQHKNLFR